MIDAYSMTRFHTMSTSIMVGSSMEILAMEIIQSLPKKDLEKLEMRGRYVRLWSRSTRRCIDAIFAALYASISTTMTTTKLHGEAQVMTNEDSHASVVSIAQREKVPSIFAKSSSAAVTPSTRARQPMVCPSGLRTFSILPSAPDMVALIFHGWEPSLRILLLGRMRLDLAAEGHLTENSVLVLFR